MEQHSSLINISPAFPPPLSVFLFLRFTGSVLQVPLDVVVVIQAAHTAKKKQPFLSFFCCCCNKPCIAKRIDFLKQEGNKHLLFLLFLGYYKYNTVIVFL